MKLLTLYLLLFFSFCQLVYAQEEYSLPEIIWLEGTWAHTTKKGVIFERWIRTSSEELTGKSFKIINSDTLIFETIRIVERMGTLFYIPKVIDQNGGRPITFELTHYTDSVLLFENPDHDFPQAIRYRRMSEDSLVAEIWGKRKGILQGSKFPMAKMSN